ncbi:hypothetical protein ZHAS_00000982 [Anopheles sinensis]|uniref:Uncharacterized protein n=1 Tax=Anopheles sinensis TaxID=74873 RepID=A0A084VAV6_ANOSI|nr:hypothetical protein ZHAS_00000982 [Anopheles sinensis]
MKNCPRNPKSRGATRKPKPLLVRSSGALSVPDSEPLLRHRFCGMCDRSVDAYKRTDLLPFAAQGEHKDEPEVRTIAATLG